MYINLIAKNSQFPIREGLCRHISGIFFFYADLANMSDFIESEAEESEEEFEEKDLKPKKTQRFMEDDGKTLHLRLFKNSFTFYFCKLHNSLHAFAFFQKRKKKRILKIRTNTVT